MAKGQISVELKGEKELQETLKRLIKQKPLEVKREVYASGLDVQREAKLNLKDMEVWDIGNLQNSILVDLEAQGFTAKIEVHAPYGPYVEYGTRKHFPPPDALEGWAKRHGFDSAWPICKVIAERGLPAKPYLIPAYHKVKFEFVERIARIFR